MSELLSLPTVSQLEALNRAYSQGHGQALAEAAIAAAGAALGDFHALVNNVASDDRHALAEVTPAYYDERIAIGTLAGAGTIGFMIPPSIIMIVYGVAAEVSIVRLFIAGVLPGLMLMALFSGYIAFWAWRHPDRVPDDGEHVPLAERFRRLRLLAPVTVLIVAVIGSIYAGIATATEAAAVGVLGALVIAGVGGSLTRESVIASLMGAVRTSCMIGFILMGAAFLTSAMSFTGLPATVATWITGLGLAPWQLLTVLTAFFVLLGCFLDGISIVVLTTAVLMPAIQAAGIDPLWFGIYLVLVVEMAQVTPPVGFNLFVIQGITGLQLFTLARMALPFFMLLVVATALITMFPQIVLVLPAAVIDSLIDAEGPLVAALVAHWVEGRGRTRAPAGTGSPSPPRTTPAFPNT